MKKFSLLSLLCFVFGLCACVSCGYLISTAVVSSNLFQYALSVEVEEQTLYAISMAKSETKSDITQNCESLQMQNGAGFVYEEDKQFYLLASVYENSNDAEKVKNNLKANNESVEVVKLKMTKTKIEGNFSTEEKNILTNAIKSDVEIFKQLYDVAISLDTDVFDITKAKLECNNIFSNHVATKTNLETFFKNKSKDIEKLQKNMENDNKILSDLINEKYESENQTFSSLIKLSYCKILLG